MQGGTRGYLKSMGFLYQNLLTELRKQTKKANGGKKQKRGKDAVEDVREDEVVEEPAEGDGAEEEVDASGQKFEKVENHENR